MDYNPEKEPTGRDINKKHDSTTLAQCGWCKYASGSHRYNYCISGSCALQKSYGTDVKWDDKCIFINASKAEIKAIIQNHEYTIKSAESTIKRHKEYIEILNKLEAKANYCPTLPDDREYNHFSIDDAIKVYFKNKWHSGFVCNGYRHHDGCVSYIIDDQEGTPGCGTAVPIVMLKTEYNFFKENPEEYKLWCDRAYNKDFNGNHLEPAPI